MITLQSGSTTAVLDTDGEEYSGGRFDHCGYVVSLQRDGVEFCGKESLIPGQGTGGSGLSCEFAIHEPIGFSEVAPGELFLKIGVGLLEKPGDKHNHMYPFRIAEPGRIGIQASGDSAVFDFDVRECNGYRVEYRKTVTLQDSRLVMDYHLKNTGSKLIDATEYCHNFLNIGGHPITGDYRFAANAVPPGSGVEESTSHGDQEHYLRLEEEDCRDLRSWELVCQPEGETGHGIREEVSFRPVRFAIWGKGHIFSPEVFVGIRLEPGQEQRWQRSFTLFSL